MKRQWVAKKRNLHGFTIVELLIVVVVIAILAAITVTAYNGISSRARQSAIQSTVEQAGKKIVTYAITNSEMYPTSLADIDIVNTSTTTYQYVVNNSVNPRSYCVSATDSSINYWMSSTNPTPTAGTCPNPIITNLVNNPKLALNATNYSPGGNVTNVGRVPVSDLAGFGYAYQANTSTSSDRIYYNDATSVLTTGQTYTLSAYVKFTPGLTVSLQAADATGTQYAASPNTTSTGAWQRLSVTFTANNTTMRLAARQVGAGNGTIALTGVSVTLGSSLYNYGDGDVAGWTWSGTPNNSSSTGVAP